MKKPNNDNTYAQMGMAALLPGMTHMLELMQRQLDDFRVRLELMQNGGEPEVQPLGRPLGSKATGKTGWPEDPAARSEEMKRRIQVAAARKEAIAAAKLRPRDRAHPDHAAWKAEQSRLRRAEWAALPERKKKERIARMLAARAGNQARKLAVAS